LERKQNAALLSRKRASVAGLSRFTFYGGAGANVKKFWYGRRDRTNFDWLKVRYMREVRISKHSSVVINGFAGLTLFSAVAYTH